MKKGERLLSLLSYFSGLIAAVAYLFGEGKAKAHGLQGLGFAAAIWVLDWLDDILRSLDVLEPMDIHPLFPYGSILAVAARFLYYIAVVIGLLAFANIHIIVCRDE